MSLNVLIPIEEAMVYAIIFLLKDIAIDALKETLQSNGVNT